MKGLLAGVLAIGLAGCAKFPDSATGGNFTRIVFRLEFAGEVNPNYIYDVAIRATTDINPETQLAPQPVTEEINGFSPNGRMAGSPTHFVEYSESSGSTDAFPFRLFVFAPGPGPNDPDNPTNLAQYTESGRRRIINFVRPTADSRFLEFELFTDQLVNTDAEAQQLNTLMVNILPMSRLQNVSGGVRVLDALGDTRSTALNDFLRIDLRQSRVYTDSGDFEPEGDTLPASVGVDPALDLVGYTIQVILP
jgi:hypothetical protein